MMVPFPPGATGLVKLFTVNAAASSPPGTTEETVSGRVEPVLLKGTETLTAVPLLWITGGAATVSTGSGGAASTVKVVTAPETDALRTPPTALTGMAPLFSTPLAVVVWLAKRPVVGFQLPTDEKVLPMPSRVIEEPGCSWKVPAVVPVSRTAEPPRTISAPASELGTLVVALIPFCPRRRLKIPVRVMFKVPPPSTTKVARPALGAATEPMKKRPPETVTPGLMVQVAVVPPLAPSRKKPLSETVVSTA